MSLFQSREKIVPALSRAEVILVRKKDRDSVRPHNLLHVVIPRTVSRQTHQRLEERNFVNNLTARLSGRSQMVEVPVVNLSSNGLMIATEAQLFPEIGEMVEVAIADSEPVRMAFRWSKGERAGLELATETMINQGALDTDGIAWDDVGSDQRNGVERHSLIWLCQIAFSNTEIVARLRNISTRGAMLSLAETAEIAPGTELALVFERAGRFDARVCWQSEDLIGVSFAEDFPLGIFAREPHLVAEDERLAAPARPVSREDSLRIRYTGMVDPTRAPDMEYTPLTLKELYYTLYDGYNPARKL